MLLSRGISQIYHTYEEDMHPYILRYRGYSEAYVITVAEDIRGAYPPSIQCPIYSVLYSVLYQQYSVTVYN